jgi:3-oxoadipate CoA-transferase beta subunit
MSAGNLELVAKAERRNRPAVARRLAEDIVDGWSVNLGIGIPLMVADNLPPDRDILIHSENGILGVGPAPAAGEVDPWVVNAGKFAVTLLPGAALFNHAESFAIIRGGHLDLCILGAFEVATNGDIANWTLASTTRLPAVGGAMDLASGARRIWVTMEHVSRDGTPKLVDACQYPLTAPGVVKRIYTDLAVLEPRGDHFAVIEIVPGLTFDDLQQLTGAPLRPAEG